MYIAVFLLFFPLLRLGAFYSISAVGMLFDHFHNMFTHITMQFDAASLTGTPRAEWFISWLPVGLATVLVWVRARAPGCDKISGSI